MKTYLLSASVAAITAGLLFAQGPLEPPAAPGPTMKTLEQIEPRTDLSTVAGSTTAMHVISTPGSYYLSGNLDVTKANGIVIDTSGVTLDLGGFSIFRSGTAAADGIAIGISGDDRESIVIENGHIRGGVTFDKAAGTFSGPGFSSGIFPFNFVAGGTRVSRVNISGCSEFGIWLYSSLPGERTDNIVEHCIVHNCGQFGIAAGEVHHCVATNCNQWGIRAGGSVSHSRGETVDVSGSFGIGIEAGVSVSFSQGISARGRGIDCVDGSVSHSTGTSGTSHGIRANLVSYSHGTSTGVGDGINAIIAVGCVATGGETITNKYIMP